MYQDSLPLYERAVQEGTNLAGFLFQSPADSHDPVVGEKVKTLVRELQRMHTQLQKLVSADHMSKLVEVEEKEDKVKQQPVAAAENKKVHHVAKREEKKMKEKPKVAVEKKEEAPAVSQPPPVPAKSKPTSKVAAPVTSSEQPIDEEENLKQLTASAQKVKHCTCSSLIYSL